MDGNSSNQTSDATPELRPYLDLTRALLAARKSYDSYAPIVRKSDPLPPKFSESLFQFEVDYTISERFDDPRPRLVGPETLIDSIKPPLEWSDVLRERLPLVSFHPAQNGMYRCRVQGRWIEISNESRCRIMYNVLDPNALSRKSEDEQRQLFANYFDGTMAFIKKSSQAIPYDLTISTTPHLSTTPGLMASSPNIKGEPDTPGNWIATNADNRWTALRGVGSDLNHEGHSSSGEIHRRAASPTSVHTEHLPMNASLLAEEDDDESDGSDLPYTVDLIQSNPAVAQFESLRKGSGLVPHSADARRKKLERRYGRPLKGSMYSHRELEEGKGLLIHLVACGYTGEQLGDEYDRIFRPGNPRTLRSICRRLKIPQWRLSVGGSQRHDSAKRQRYFQDETPVR
ncbi:hypothetical protein N7457_001373 [Penicillium paradoxum]|uniref:uncharacterized protein n=1 Tax=Penicillium paradoxum TaxID=176176 RepID=UPI002549AD55|nr:uncharacterized protein N7457_001373 [Penicillium paradoxum]KAJ5794774.1 hypothetical protein N7457_001373 [Penicillium paradoxum]